MRSSQDLEGGKTQDDKASRMSHLASQGFEKCGRPHNGVRDLACLAQLGLEGQLGMLELQQRLLHAHGAEQDKV